MNARRITSKVHIMSIMIAFSASCHSTTALPIAPTGAASGPLYYVSTAGSDQGNGTTSKPWRTISYAVTRLRAGDTLLVRGGTYDDWLDNPQFAGTSWDASIRIAAYPNETVWMTPSGGFFALDLANAQQYIEFDAINIDARRNKSGSPIRIEGFSRGNAHHIRIKNAEIISGSDGVPNQGTGGGPAIMASATQAGIIGNNEFYNLRIHGGGDPGDFAYAFYIQSNDNVIDGCDIYDTSGAGIQIYNGYGQWPTNNIIRNNSIHDIRRSADTRYWGIVEAGRGTQIINNRIFNIGSTGGVGAGIDLYKGSGQIVDGNSVYGANPIGIFIETDVSGAVVSNNVTYNNGIDLIDHGRGTTLSGNSVSPSR
jgi:hypothetical protein